MVVACIVFATCACVVGCRQSQLPAIPTGGDSPVTAQRLTGTRLTDIREPLSWRFKGSTVLLDYAGQPIPSELVEALLGDRLTPVRIEASWHLDEEAGTLHLSDVKADEASIDKEVTISIGPAGHVRVNLGSRQYNMFRDSAEDP